MMSQMPSVCLALYEVYSLVEAGLWEDGIASGFICLVVSSRFQMQVSCSPFPLLSLYDVQLLFH